ncbi:MAG: DUF799 domain-containing protein [Alphaproteobacteria bacterium]|nr:DUF799 domain-containing protein [Alphaproteobacteria bacterium]
MRLILVGPFVCLLGACMAATGGTPPEHRVEAAFWTAPPECVVVLPAMVSGPLDVRAAERAFFRHLVGRIAVVVGPDRRDAETRALALDLRHPGDRRRYADLTGCRHGVDLTVSGDRAYAVIWTEGSIALDAALIDLATGSTLWRSRHRATRGDGGLPTSPVGLAMALGRAGRLASDGELMPSVLDDALRRLVATLPDTRVHAVSRNSNVRPLSSRK